MDICSENCCQLANFFHEFSHPVRLLTAKLFMPFGFMLIRTLDCISSAIKFGLCLFWQTILTPYITFREFSFSCLDLKMRLMCANEFYSFPRLKIDSKLSLKLVARNNRIYVVTGFLLW